MEKYYKNKYRTGGDSDEVVRLKLIIDDLYVVIKEKNNIISTLYKKYEPIRYSINILDNYIENIYDNIF